MEKMLGPMPEWIPREIKPKFHIYFDHLGKITKSKELTTRKHRNAVKL